MKQKTKKQAELPKTKKEKKPLSHHPIALGFSALAAMTVIGCSPGKAPHSDKYVAAALCKSTEGLETHTLSHKLLELDKQAKGQYVVLTYISKDDQIREFQGATVSSELSEGKDNRLKSHQFASVVNDIASIDDIPYSLGNQSRIAVESTDCNPDKLDATISSPAFGGQKQVKILGGKKSADFDSKKFKSLDGKYEFTIKISSEVEKTEEGVKKVKLSSKTFEANKHSIIFKAVRNTGEELIIISQALHIDQLHNAQVNMTVSQLAKLNFDMSQLDGLGEENKAWVPLRKILPISLITGKGADSIDDENKILDIDFDLSDIPGSVVVEPKASANVAVSSASANDEVSVVTPNENASADDLVPVAGIEATANPDQVIAADMDQANDTESELANTPEVQTEALNEQVTHELEQQSEGIANNTEDDEKSFEEKFDEAFADRIAKMEEAKKAETANQSQERPRIQVLDQEPLPVIDQEKLNQDLAEIANQAQAQVDAAMASGADEQAGAEDSGEPQEE